MFYAFFPSSFFFSRSFHAYIRVICVRYMAMVEERERRHTENLTLYVASIRSLILVNIAKKIADFLSSCCCCDVFFFVVVVAAILHVYVMCCVSMDECSSYGMNEWRETTTTIFLGDFSFAIVDIHAAPPLSSQCIATSAVSWLTAVFKIKQNSAAALSYREECLKQLTASFEQKKRWAKVSVLLWKGCKTGFLLSL